MRYSGNCHNSNGVVCSLLRMCRTLGLTQVVGRRSSEEVIRLRDRSMTPHDPMDTHWFPPAWELSAGRSKGILESRWRQMRSIPSRDTGPLVFHNKPRPFRSPLRVSNNSHGLSLSSTEAD